MPSYTKQTNILQEDFQGSPVLRYQWGISRFDHLQKVNQQLTQTKPYNTLPA